MLLGLTSASASKSRLIISTARLLPSSPLSATTVSTAAAANRRPSSSFQSPLPLFSPLSTPRHGRLFVATLSTTALSRQSDREEPATAAAEEEEEETTLERYYNPDRMATKEKQEKSKAAAVQLKTPKGTRDWTGADSILRDEIFQTVSDVFKRHGAVPLDTPVFELKEVLAGKYGEDSRLIYDLADQGGELCALRYDLTVPFARWLAMNKVQQFRRYHIAKVYRRDQPAVARGRMREFYQCDFDIAGQYDRMIPDAEVLRVVHEVFAALREEIVVKLNHRQILDGIFAVSGVPDDKIRTISSAVDKLDKLPWADIRREMVEEKGLAEAVADQIGEYVKHSGDIAAVVALLRADARLCADANIRQGVEDMELLATYLEALGVPSSQVSFDLSLCRGLDYYTGLIFEVVVKPASAPAGDAAAASAKKKSSKAAAEEEPQVGSIAAGGRYDNLVGMYGKTQIPCVGISFGVDRIFTILKARREKETGRAARVRETDVYVMAFGAGAGFSGLLTERMRIARRLWDAGIKAEFVAKTKPRLPQQFKAAEDVPLGVILGEDELAKGQVRLKVLSSGGSSASRGANGGASGGDADEKDRGQLVSEEDLAAEIKKLLI